MKLKKKSVYSEQRAEKIILSGKTAMMVDEYAKYYESVYNEKIALSELIVEMLKAFTKSDREFVRWMRIKEDKEGEKEKIFKQPNNV